MDASKNKISLFDFTFVVVSLVIGMGIFRTATNSAQYVSSSNMFFAAWIFGGIIAYCGALTYAEIGSRLPVTGGYYKVFSYAYHPSIAFSINCVILISNAASLAVVALIGSSYLLDAILPNANKSLEAVIAIIAILVFYGVNLLGLKMSAKTQTVLMFIKIGMIVFLISGLFFPQYYNTDAVTATKHLKYGAIISFGLAMKAVCFTYGGYQQTINFGNEIQNPQRNIPKGIFYGIAIIISLYLLTNLSYYKIIGFNSLSQGSKQIGSVLVQKVYGVKTATIFGALLFLCVLSYVNALLLSNPRVMYAMAQDGDLPKIFAETKGKKEVLFVGLTTFTIICVVVLFWGEKVDDLLSFSMFLDCFGMMLSAAAIFKLRRKTTDLDKTGIFKLKLYPFLPIVFILSYAFVAFALTIEKPNLGITAIVVMAGFVGLHFVLKALKK